MSTMETAFPYQEVHKIHLGKTDDHAAIVNTLAMLLIYPLQSEIAGNTVPPMLTKRSFTYGIHKVSYTYIHGSRGLFKNNEQLTVLGSAQVMHARYLFDINNEVSIDKSVWLYATGESLVKDSSLITDKYGHQQLAQPRRSALENTRTSSALVGNLQDFLLRSELVLY